VFQKTTVQISQAGEAIATATTAAAAAITTTFRFLSDRPIFPEMTLG